MMIFRDDYLDPQVIIPDVNKSLSKIETWSLIGCDFTPSAEIRKVFFRHV